MYVFIYLCIYVFIYLCIYLYICLFVYLCIYLYVYLFIYLCIYVCIYLFVYLFIYLFVYLCIYVCIYLFIYLFFQIQRGCRRRFNFFAFELNYPRFFPCLAIKLSLLLNVRSRLGTHLACYLMAYFLFAKAAIA